MSDTSVAVMRLMWWEVIVVVEFAIQKPDTAGAFTFAPSADEGLDEAEFAVLAAAVEEEAREDEEEEREGAGSGACDYGGALGVAA